MMSLQIHVRVQVFNDFMSASSFGETAQSQEYNRGVRRLVCILASRLLHRWSLRGLTRGRRCVRGLTYQCKLIGTIGVSRAQTVSTGGISVRNAREGLQ